MTAGHFRIFVLVMGTMYLISGSVRIECQNTSQFVAITGLGRSYNSCTPVNLSVRNISKQEVYVEVYVEENKSGSWKDVACQYDIKDPRSRYIKRILTNPKMTRPGESFTLQYDRCSDFESCFIHMFGKNDVRASRLTLMQGDEKATSPVLERFEIEIFVRDPDNVNTVKRVAKEYSQPFARIADKKSN